MSHVPWIIVDRAGRRYNERVSALYGRSQLMTRYRAVWSSVHCRLAACSAPLSRKF
jgi:hypothetical protein